MGKLKEYKERTNKQTEFDESARMTPFVKISLAEDKDQDDCEEFKNLENNR